MEFIPFNTFNFDIELINWLEKHLKSKVIGQDEVIDQIIDIFTKNMIKWNDEPSLNFSLFWKSWIWKSLIIKEMSKYLNKETWSFETTVIDCSKLYTAELSTTLYWVSEWFSDWNPKGIIYNIINNMEQSDDRIWGHILVLSEVDKLKWEYNKDNIIAFFETIMQLFEERFHLVNWIKWKTNIDLWNFIIAIDTNLYLDKQIEQENENKIWFNINENNTEKKTNNISKQDILNNLKSILPISVYNRIYSWIIRMNDLWWELLWSIFKIEYKKIVNDINYYISKNWLNIKEFLTEAKKEDYNKMLKNLKESEWARGIRNYCNNTLKLNIIKNNIIPLHKKKLN
jgi:hypothetical protein